MTVWIAFLRAVNVGGRNMLPMAELRTALAEAGLPGVKTHVQSGNLVFRSDAARHTLGPLIADVILSAFKFRPPVLILSEEELSRAVGGPFPKAAEEDPATLHLYFMERALPEATGAFLKSVAAPGEAWGYRGKLLWLHLPGGLARSKLAQRVSALPLDITARNLRSARAVLEIAQKMGARAG